MLVRHFRSHQHDNYQGHLLCTIILGQRFLLEPDIEALSLLILIVLLLGIGLLLPPPDGRHHSYFHSGNSFFEASLANFTDSIYIQGYKSQFEILFWKAPVIII